MIRIPSYFEGLGFRYRPAGTISATVPPGATNLTGITPGSLMI